jgi:hypothetical protein
LTIMEHNNTTRLNFFWWILRKIPCIRNWL